MPPKPNVNAKPKKFGSLSGLVNPKQKFATFKEHVEYLKYSIPGEVALILTK